MRCLTCVRAGDKSSVQILETIETNAATTTFYDEEDNLHMHDPNGTLHHCMCSNGHEFNFKEFYGCMDDDCDYGQDTEDYYIIDGNEIRLDDRPKLTVVE